MADTPQSKVPPHQPGGPSQLQGGGEDRPTVPVPPPAAGGVALPPSPLGESGELVTVTINGQAYRFPKGTNLLDACNLVGCNVPFFCYHPGLSSPAVCRQCLVEVKGQPKPVPSCYTPVADKMEVFTATPKVLDVRRQMLEFTLLNHPIDCPICDKAGECTLQRLYFDWDAKYARNDGIKVRKAKVVDIGPHIVLDQERCILCTRCIRVCNEVAHSPDLTMANRGDRQILTTSPGRRLDNPYSLNTVDVCPVGALTSKDFRFAMRVWELFSTPSICPGCATGCNVELHSSRAELFRMVPRPNPAVNRYWMCDEGRFTYKRIKQERVAAPLVGHEVTTWERALDEAARALRAVLDRDPGRVGVVFSAQATNEDLHVLAGLAFDHLHLERAYLAGRREGWHDSILVSADKNPNTAGALAIGGGRLKSVAELHADLRAGALSALLVLGDEGVLGAAEEPAPPLDGLEALVVLAWRHGALAGAAHVLLPLADWAEVDGTFTNRHGMVQRIRAAVPPPGEAQPGWEGLGRLGRKLGAVTELESARQVFDAARAHHAFMKDAEWGRVLLPVQLRFANTRG